MQTNTLSGLTSIRFFAALWVVLFHLRGNWSLPWWLDSFVSAGYSGVTLFFVLSGFILSYNYLPRQFTLREFWSARAARVLPVYFFALLASLPFSVHKCHEDGMAFFPSAVPALVLIQAWIPKTAATWNAPGWSLSCEAFFYLLFPFLLKPFARLSQNHLPSVLGATWLLGMIPSTLYALDLPEGPVDLYSSAAGLNAIKFNPLLRLPEFLLGMAFGILYLNGRRMPRPLIATAGSVMLLALILVSSVHLPYPAFHNGFLAPLYGVLILALASAPRMLANPLLELLGESSYSLYILHSPILSCCHSAAKRLAWPEHGIVALGWITIAVAVSIATYKTVEVPARVFLRSRLARGSLTVPKASSRRP